MRDGKIVHMTSVRHSLHFLLDSDHYTMYRLAGNTYLIKTIPDYTNKER